MLNCKQDLQDNLESNFRFKNIIKIMNAHVNYARKGSGSFGLHPKRRRKGQRAPKHVRVVKNNVLQFYALSMPTKMTSSESLFL